ncbi:MAG: fructosamine kinase family protein [Bacteroidota bacterium]
MLPDEIQSFCSDSFGTIKSFRHCPGGCINNGGRIETTSGGFFIKWNSATRFPKMFSMEKQGLELLSNADGLTIPEVQKVYEGVQYSCLVLEYIESGPRLPGYWKELGEGLALLHSQNAESFGLDHDNYIGSLRQSNSQHKDWIEFFINERIAPQIELAISTGAMQSNEAKNIERLYKRFTDLLVLEKPCLIHGDLWSGNIMIDVSGSPAIIDPAVSFANREMDIAMTRLFGSLPNEFYASYNETKPLTPGWEDRLDLYNLYPLLVHVNLFGGGYLSQVIQIANRYH